MPADSSAPLRIQFQRASKKGKLRFRALWREVREHKAWQALLLGGSFVVLMQVTLFLLVSLVGAAIAALALLFILEKAYGLKISGPAYAF